jgi:ATP-dependent DNA ligase
MSLRPLSSAFIAPCLPSSSKTPSSGKEWLHEIKHDGFCSIVRKEGKRVKLYSRPGNDLTYRFRSLPSMGHAALEMAKSSHVGGASSAGFAVE